MPKHNFYLIELNNINVLKNLDIYITILDIDRNIKQNGFNGINIIDKVDIDDDFIEFFEDFLKFIPNDTPEEIQLKSNFGLNNYGITILKDGKKIYNILNKIYYCIIEPIEDIFYLQEVYINHIYHNTKIINQKEYSILQDKKHCKKYIKKILFLCLINLKIFL